MKNILFLLVPHLSHYYPTFGLAHLLKRQGYSICYAGTNKHKLVVEQEGFIFKDIEYREEIVISNLYVAFALCLKTRLDPTYTLSRYRHFLNSMQAVEKLMVDAKPDVVFLDDTLANYFPCLKKNIKVIHLSTKLSPKRRLYVPPLNSHYIPKNRLIDLLIADALWFMHVNWRSFNKSIHSIVFGGRSDTEFQRRYEQNKNKYQPLRNRNTVFYDLIASIQGLILAPKELDFNFTKSSFNESSLYVPYARDEKKYFTSEYTNFLEKILSHKKVNKTKLIYVALGTLSKARVKRAQRFLSNVINALTGNQSFDVLIAAGGLNIQTQFINSNICVLPTVPQLDILKHTDLMITHGGLGTIKECLAEGVPMLVYPLNTNSDQPGNSARVVYKKLGLRGTMNELPAIIHKKVIAILENPIYQENCQKAKQFFIEDIQENHVVLERLGLYKKDLSNSSHIN